MEAFRRFPAHNAAHLSLAAPVFHRVHNKRQACTLYSAPAASSDLPVLEDVTIAWQPDCVKMGSDTIDLYLSVQSPQDGLLAVHQWKDVAYDEGFLTTQLQPSWWNASTGAGSVSAQFSIVASDQPLWNSAAPAGPLFTITYNGTYPSTAPAPVYTGPSVESVGGANSAQDGISGSKLAVAVAVPILVSALLLGAYLAWHRLRKRPDTKRFSAVVDERMSMYSAGTWHPRASMASRPGSSFHPRASGSASIHSGHDRPFAHDLGGRPGSAYSTMTPSPLGGGASSIRAPPPAEMRQIGHGERASRVSFRTVGGGDEAPSRPSFSSSTTATRRGLPPTGSTLRASHLRRSTAGSEALDDPSEGDEEFRSVRTSPSGLSMLAKSSSSSTLSLPSSAATAPPARHHTRSVSALRQEVERPESPFDDSAAVEPMPRQPRPTLQLHIHTAPDDSHMPTAYFPHSPDRSLMSPDQALASYAAVAIPSPSVETASASAYEQPTAAAGAGELTTLTRSASSFSRLKAMPGRMLRSLSATSASARSSSPSHPPVQARSREVRTRPVSTAVSVNARPMSPFDDPLSDEEEDEKGESGSDSDVIVGLHSTGQGEGEGEGAEYVRWEAAERDSEKVDEKRETQSFGTAL